MAFEFTDANFIEKTKDQISVVDFWAEWCGPCRLIAPIISELADEYDENNVLVGKLNVDHNPAVASQFGIRSIPTILIMKNGKIVDRHVGTTTKQFLKKKIDAQLVA